MCSSDLFAFIGLVMMFSLAGIPPTVGFAAKLGVLEALVDAEHTFLAIIAVIASLIGAFYYLRVVKVMYFDEPAEALDAPAMGVARAVAFAAALLIAVFSLAPQPLSSVAAAAAKGLFP